MLVEQIILLIAGTVLGLITLALLARFFMQWGRVSFRNPVGHFIITFTDWAVLPARRLIPGLFGLDMASLLLAWMAQTLYALIASGLSPVPMGTLLVVPFLGLIALIRMMIYLVLGVVLISVVLSWVGPQVPAAWIFDELSRPFLAPFRRLIRPIGGIDLSPLLLFMILQIALMVLSNLQMRLFMPSFF